MRDEIILTVTHELRSLFAEDACAAETPPIQYTYHRVSVLPHLVAYRHSSVLRRVAEQLLDVDRVVGDMR